MLRSAASAPRPPLHDRIWNRSLPWLCSSGVHVALLLVLNGILVITHGAADPKGVTAGISLTATLQDSSAGQNKMPIVEFVHQAGGPAEYFEDDGEAVAQPLVADTQPQPQLDEVLAQVPPVDLRGVLPGALPPSATSRAEGLALAAGGGLLASPGPRRNVRGGQARTGVFGVQGEGYKFVYVFDRSGSMEGHGGAPLRAAKQQLIESLGSLDSTHQFQIIFYNDRPRIFNPTGNAGRLVFGTPQNKNRALQFIGGITGDGATEHESAIELALRLAPDVIFFLTDADEPRLSADQLSRIARLNRGSSINAIEFGYGVQGEADNFLVRLAQQNGGRHVYVDISHLLASELSAAER